MEKYICIHGHFYQPPRENPWLETIEMQDEAYPYHDWNQRINAECYACNATSRILDQQKRIIDIVNNYTRMSFDFGPTLLSWLEKYEPNVYRSILEADKESQKLFSGHGSAIAQVYNHIIMPLANKRDKITQIVWGIRDFEYRFNRKPEGMWLAETAVDVETLELLAGYEIKFTILSPHQAEQIRANGTNEWQDVKGGNINPNRPYTCHLPSGKQISIFFYNGSIAHDISFGDLLKDGKNFAHRLASSFNGENNKSQLVHIATDGETYGHHHRFGDMALAYCYYYLELNKLAKITNYGEFLEKFPPTHEVQIINNSSWSCAHGIERWRADCGCCTGGEPGWNQKWREPLRSSLDWLRDTLIPVYEQQTALYLNDPWLARNEYIDVILDRTMATINNFIEKHSARPLNPEERIKVLKLMEMQRHTLLMYTSCGWFFNDISGIESIQIIRYAERALQLAEEVAVVVQKPDFIKKLIAAKSNKPQFGDGAQLYEKYVESARIDLARVGAHYAIASFFDNFNGLPAQTYSYTTKNINYEKLDVGKFSLALGQVMIMSQVTCEEKHLDFAILHLGDHNINGGVRLHTDEEAYTLMYQDIRTAFEKSDIPLVIRNLDKRFVESTYSLRHLFKDEQRRVLDEILKTHEQDITSAFYGIYESYYPMMQAMLSMQVPLPPPFFITGEYITNTKLKTAFENGKINYEEAKRVFEEGRKFSFKIDKPTLEFAASNKILQLMNEITKQPENRQLFEYLETILKLVKDMVLDIDLWQAQNIYFGLRQSIRPALSTRAKKQDADAQTWLALFDRIGTYLMMHCIVN